MKKIKLPKQSTIKWIKIKKGGALPEPCKRVLVVDKEGYCSEAYLNEDFTDSEGSNVSVWVDIHLTLYIGVRNLSLEKRIIENTSVKYEYNYYGNDIHCSTWCYQVKN